MTNTLPYNFCRWGCTHEKDALEAYTKKLSGIHKNFLLKNAGLFISIERPYIGASPDGIVMCDCCGKGAVEVKCPFCFKDGLPEEDSPKFCMKKNEGMNIHACMLL